MQALIVGPHRSSHHAIEEALRARGHTVYPCEDVDEAWETFAREQPHLVVLTGLEADALALSRRIRETAHGDAIILLALIRADEEYNLDALLAADVDDCIADAADRAYLDARLTLALRRSQLRVQRRQVEKELVVRGRQQAMVADLGLQALAGTSLQNLMDHAARIAAEALGASFSKVLVPSPDDDDLLVLQAGVGWDDALIGKATVRRSPDTQAGYTLQVFEPVIVEDWATETRFTGPSLLHTYGIASGVSVILTAHGDPYGVLGVHTTVPRAYSSDDVNFLQAVANVLAGAIEGKQAEEALRDGEARTRAILETTVDGIIIIDERGCVETYNPAAERVFGYAADEVIGRNIAMLMPSPYAEEHDSYIQSYLETGHRKIIGIGREVIGRRKDGSVFPMELAVSEVKLDDGRRLFAGMVRDITERRRLEQEILRISEEERRRIGQDLHDGLGQMLTGIGLITQNLARVMHEQDATAAAEMEEVTELIREADQHARGLARGLVPVDLEATGLAAALDRLANNAERLFGIRCTFERVGTVLIHDNTVATHLYRIAQEAVSNAVKHGRARHVRVTLASGRGHIRLRIQDDGVGFPDKIDEERQGMGVRIMHYRARVIGATLDIANGIDGGTTITCTFRRTNAPPPQAEEMAGQH